MEHIYNLLIYSPTFVTAWWSIILLKENKKTYPAKNFLGFFMLASAFVFFSHVIYFANDHIFYSFIDWLYTFASLSVYPLALIYIKMLSNEKGFDIKNLLFLLPAIFFSLLTFISYLIMDNPEEFVKVVLYKKEIKFSDLPSIYKFQTVVTITSRFVFFIQIIIFLLLSIKEIKDYRAKVSNYYSNIEGRDLRWVNYFLITSVITAVVSITTNWAGRTSFLDGSYLVFIPAILFSSLLFILGHLGYKQEFSISDFIKEVDAEDKAAYTSNPLEPIHNKLINLFEDEKVFVRSDLRISELSLMLQTNRAYVSRTINEVCGCSFNDFVNKYRIEESIKLMKKDITIDQIAEESGFSSTSSFIRVFKQFKNATPGQYRKRNFG